MKTGFSDFKTRIYNAISKTTLIIVDFGVDQTSTEGNLGAQDHARGHLREC